jgi:Cu(I)/Ag(I) efflux system protein CusF
LSRVSQLILVIALAASFAAAAQPTAAPAPHTHDHGATQPATATASAPQTDGEIRKVDVAGQKLTVKHGRIENLDMSAMTMVFRVKDPAFLTAVKPGDKVKMKVERIDGALTIVELQRQP